MAAARRHVPSDERILFAARPSWRWVILHLTVPAIVLSLAVLFVYWLKDGVEPVLPTLAPLEGWAVPLLITIGILKVIWQILVRQSRLYIVTDRRIASRFGVFNRGGVDLTHERIQEVVLRRNLDERLFGIGSIGFATAAGGIDLAWIGIARVREAYEMAQRLAERPGGVRHGVTATSASAAPGRREAGGDPVSGGSVAAASEAAGDGGQRRKRPVVIGIVGGIGSGKSRVAKEFESLGAVVSDSDTEAKAALEREDVKQRIREWWGDGVFDEQGRVDRRAVAKIVFADERERQRLEGLIHPLLRDKRAALIERAAEAGTPAVIIDAPLLFEAGLEKECDAVVFVDAPREVRAERVKESRGWEEAELARREAAQLPLEEKRLRSTFVLRNDGKTTDLREQVIGVLRTLIRGWEPPDRQESPGLA